MKNIKVGLSPVQVVAWVFCPGDVARLKCVAALLTEEANVPYVVTV